MNASEEIVSPSRITSIVDENINKIKENLLNNRKLTIRELAAGLPIIYGSIQNNVVNGLGFRRVTAKLVPKNLNLMQKRGSVDIAKDMIPKAESDTTFSISLITEAERRVYEYYTQSRVSGKRIQASEGRAPKKTRP